MNSRRKKHIVMIDYIPAELKANKDWLVVYRYKNSDNEMIRKRIRVPKLQNKTLRTRYAKRLCAEINSKLEKGWTPEIEMEASNCFKLLKNARDEYLLHIKVEIKNKNLRPDTLRSYTSYLKILSKFLKINETEFRCLNFSRGVITSFLDYLTIKRQVSNRTYNNYLGFLNTFCIYMLKREFISKNPCEGILGKREGEKIRQIIPPHVRSEIQNYLVIHNPSYFILCLCTYFLILRRTEATKLRVGAIDFDNNCVTVGAEVSKNKKTAIITIPEAYKELLRNHVARAKQSDYVFSANNYLPGATQLTPKKISDEWAKMRTSLNLENYYQFYSLKDTAITEMLQSGIAPIKVRDQARHHDLSETEKYTPRRKVADKSLMKMNLSF